MTELLLQELGVAKSFTGRELVRGAGSKDGQRAGRHDTVAGQHGPYVVGPRKHAGPAGHAYQARGPGIRPRHGTMGLFRAVPACKSPQELTGRVGP
jgi:hypothetical protein